MSEEATNNEGGLPSDEGNDTPESQFNGEYSSEQLKDGKLFGKFSDVDELAKSYRELELAHTNKMRDFSDEAKAREARAEEAKIAEEKATVQRELMTSMIDEYSSNGYKLSDEQTAKLEESGIDIRDIKLGAIELRDRVNAAHKVVGGADNYQRMMDWAKENLDETQKKAFDTDIVGSASEFAIKGLYADYSSNTGNGGARIGGSNNLSNNMNGYQSTAEMLKDKSYLTSFKGKSDTKAHDRFKAKMANTSDKVVFGR